MNIHTYANWNGDMVNTCDECEEKVTSFFAKYFGPRYSQENPVTHLATDYNSAIVCDICEAQKACTHPNHIDGTSCEDRTIACHPDCACCIPEGVIWRSIW